MFYDKFKYLCEKRGVSPAKAAYEIGFSNATPTTWKKRGLTPKGDSLQKIAGYFNVSIEYLLSDDLSEETKKEPDAPEGARLTDDDIRFALFGGNEDITDEMFEEVKRFAAYVRAREKEKKGSTDDRP